MSGKGRTAHIFLSLAVGPRVRAAAAVTAYTIAAHTRNNESYYAQVDSGSACNYTERGRERQRRVGERERERETDDDYSRAALYQQQLGRAHDDTDAQLFAPYSW